MEIWYYLSFFHINLHIVVEKRSGGVFGCVCAHVHMYVCI